ncbi:RraA family protein [Rhizobium sp. CFBP 8752]|uniref:RraA family protein n=1 Tax=Rhizobium sp. CFBP 8752 TaxID=2775301 RepID=UPI00237AFF8A|nr:RraA family protein [Rhizobium sp. CFBP 8752]
MTKIGFRMLERTGAPVPRNVIDAFLSIGVAQASDCMGRLYGSQELTAIHGTNQRMAGTALTVKTRPGDNLLIHQAIASAQPGDIIVVDGGGCTANALVGELMLKQAQARGIAGFVIDGMVRDAEAFEREKFPCFARGLSHRGPFKDGPGELNVPVAVGGLVVQAGDVIIGDLDGLLSIPASHAAEVLAMAQATEASEQKRMTMIAAGTYQKPWLVPALAKLAEDYA